MARTKSRTKAEATDDTAIVEETVTDSTSFNPAEFDPQMKQQADAVVQGVADSTRLEPEPASNGFASQHAPRTTSTGHIANPSSKRRESHAASVGRRLPATLSVLAGDMLVRLIDKGDNRAGIGIRVELPEGRTLTDEEKEIIRQHVKGAEGEQPSGFSWDRDNQMWHKEIVRQGERLEDVPPAKPIAIRMDAEKRVAALAEALRDHSVDPVSYADRVRQQREQAANSERIPD